jgi:hypothetical protein
MAARTVLPSSSCVNVARSSQHEQQDVGDVMHDDNCSCLEGANTASMLRQQESVCITLINPNEVASAL